MAEKSLEAHLYECLKRGNTERGDTKKALYIIKLLGDDVNKLYRGKSPLLWAKEFENKEVARVLKEKGAVEKAISEEEAEKLGIELIEKAKVGDLDAVIELIEEGAKVNQKSKYEGTTALMFASLNGRVEVVKTLIEKGADVNQKNRQGETALMYASLNGHLEIVERLIEAGANLEQKDHVGRTALMSASGNGNVEVVKTLIENGADVNEKDNADSTPLMWASADGNVEVVKTLIENGANVNQKSEYDGSTALTMASSRDRVEVVKTLIEHGAKVDEKDNDGDTAITRTSNYEIKKMLREVLRKQKMMNVKNKISDFFGIE